MIYFARNTTSHGAQKICEDLREQAFVNDELFDIIIIGGGPAGLTSAIYASRMGMKTLLLETKLFGGKALEAPIVENFPGFPEGIGGVELMEKMAEQAKNSGAEMRTPLEVVDLSLNGKAKIVTTKSGKYQSLGIIIATGTQRKKLLVPGETEFLGRGVSYCAVCDGPLFRGKTTAVIGFDDEALEDTLFLSNLSKRVVLITQRDEIEAAKTLVDRCRKKANVEILKARVKSILGDTYVRSVEILYFESDDERKIPLDGIFISMGGVPMTNLVKKAGIIVDERGCIKVDRRQATNLEGVFAAGDCTCGGMQIITAAGEGAMAAIQAYMYVKRIRM